MTSLVFDILYRDHGASKGLRDLGNQADQAGVKYAKFRRVAGVAALAAGAAILKFGKDSVAAYADAESSQQKLSFTLAKFPRLADTNQASLQRLNSALQLKTRFDDDAIASGQAVLGSFKMTGRQLEQVTPLMLDFAAKTGKDLPTAARAMGQAFLGNTRALKEIGINYKSTGDQAKDFANITALMRKQVGGFAQDEGKTAAGQLEILRNQFGELQEAAGAELVPTLNSLTGWAIKGVRAIGEYGDVLIPVAAGVGGLAAVIWGADKAQRAWAVTQAATSGLAARGVAGLNALKFAYSGVEFTAKASARAMRIAQLSIPVVGIALFGVTTAMARFASKSDESTAATVDFGSAMQSVEGDVTRATAALNENVRAQAVSALQSKGAYDQAARLGIAYEDVTDAALGNQSAIGRVNAALRAALTLNPQVSKSNSDQRNTAQALAGTLGGVARESKNAAEQERIRRIAMQKSEPATRTLGEAQADLKKATRDLNGELQKSVDKLTILKEGALSVERANVNWEESLDNLRKSTKENGKTLDAHTSKGRDNRRAIVGAFEALNEKTKSDYKNAASSKNAEKAVKQANERYRDNRRDLRRAAEAAGYSKSEVEKMIRQYLKTPKELKTDVSTPGVTSARTNMRKLDDEINDLNSKSVSIKVKYSKSGAVRLGVTRNDRGGGVTKDASGGVLPGYTPGRDVHYFQALSPGVPDLHLSGGEAIMRPEWVKAIGGVGEVHRQNRLARTGRLQAQALASGGVYRNIRVRASANNPPNVSGDYASAYAYARSQAASSARAAAVASARAEVARQKAAARRAAARARAGGGDGGYSGPVGGGSSGIRRIANSYNPSYIAGHRDPQGGPAFDIGSSGSKNNNIANALRSNHGKLGLRYVISRMRIASGRSGWRWRGYTPITGSGDFRHVNHVHVSYDKGGMLPSGGTGANRSGRPERVLSPKQTMNFERLTQSISRSGGAVVHNHFTINAPNYVGPERELVKALETLDSRGALDKVARNFARRTG